MSYFVIRGNLVQRNVDWSFRREHVEAKGLTTEHADEALDDPERVAIDPGPRSITGDSVRVIGYSRTADELLTVVVVIREKKLFGATAWKASKREHHLYWNED